MIATQPEFSDENCWFLDSAVTNHVTNDISNLSISSEYKGSGKIHMDNGTGLPISRIGYTSFETNSRFLHSKDLLHVAFITKNLLSVSQFCADTDIFFFLVSFQFLFC